MIYRKHNFETGMVEGSKITYHGKDGAYTSYEYHISTGSKGAFYTLWVTRTVYLGDKVRDEQKELVAERLKERAQNPGLYTGGLGCGYYWQYFYFIQNLATTKEEAIAKAKELTGMDIPEDMFQKGDRWKPEFRAFGAKWKQKRKSNPTFYSEATPEFWEAWRANKDHMRENGFFCSKYEGKWYMFKKQAELEVA